MPISLIFPRHCVYYVNFAEMQRRYVFCVFIGISLRIQIDSLINTVRVFSDDIRMKFGLKKCAVVVMQRGKVVKYDEVDLPDGRRMKSVEEDGYKYLGILEYSEVLHVEMKTRLQNEYYRRLKRILKSKLNGKNVIMAVNTSGLYQCYDMGPV